MNIRQFVLTMILAILAVSVLEAQSAAARGSRNYNPATEVTINGTVNEVSQSTGKHGWSGIHLSVADSKGTYDVHVGPASYVTAQRFTFERGEQIELIGSKVNVDGKEAVIARQIKKNGATLTLRDQQGLPKWSGASRNNQ